MKFDVHKKESKDNYTKIVKVKNIMSDSQTKVMNFVSGHGEHEYLVS